SRRWAARRSPRAPRRVCCRVCSTSRARSAQPGAAAKQPSTAFGSPAKPGAGDERVAPDIRVEMVVRRDTEPGGNLHVLAGARAAQDPVPLHFSRRERQRAQPIQIELRGGEPRRKTRSPFELLERRSQQPLGAMGSGRKTVEARAGGPERLAD